MQTQKAAYEIPYKSKIPSAAKRLSFKRYGCGRKNFFILKWQLRLPVLDRQVKGYFAAL
jgi:hypothetical protein